jgi:hypothetical protein
MVAEQMGAVAVVSCVSEGLNLAFDLARLRDVVWVNPDVLTSGGDADEVLSETMHSDRDHTSMLRALCPAHLGNIVSVVVVKDPLHPADGASCLKLIRDHSTTGVMSVIDVSAQSLRDAHFAQALLFRLAEHPQAAVH